MKYGRPGRNPKPIKLTKDGLPGDGAVDVSMGIQKDKLVLVFSKPVTWLAYGRADLEAHIAELQKRLELLVPAKGGA